MSETPTYVLEREFDAPRELVWRTWTEAPLLARWYGPNVETVIHEIDMTPGGRLLVEMRWTGGARYERMDILDVDAPRRLVWLQSMADAAWEIAVSPSMPDWPRVLHTDITFEERGAKTGVTLIWTPHQATAAEEAFFAQAIAGADKGWNMGMDMLESLLEELQR